MRCPGHGAAFGPRLVHLSPQGRTVRGDLPHGYDLLPVQRYEGVEFLHSLEDSATVIQWKDHNRENPPMILSASDLRHSCTCTTEIAHLVNTRATLGAEPTSYSTNHFFLGFVHSPSCCSPRPPPRSPFAPAPSAPLYWWGKCSLLIVGAFSARTVQNSCMHIHHRRPTEVQAVTETEMRPLFCGSCCVLCGEGNEGAAGLTDCAEFKAPAGVVWVLPGAGPWSGPDRPPAAPSASQPRGESPSAPPEGRDGGFSVFRRALTCEEDSEGANSKTSRHTPLQESLNCLVAAPSERNRILNSMYALQPMTSPGGSGQQLNDINW